MKKEKSKYLAAVEGAAIIHERKLNMYRELVQSLLMFEPELDPYSRKCLLAIEKANESERFVRKLCNNIETTLNKVENLTSQLKKTTND
jgi:hypothetical protein